MLGREDVGPAGEVLLDDVVLGRAGELGGDLADVELPGFCSSAATWYIASIHIAVALIVIEVFIPVSGMSSKSRRISPRCGTGHADLADLAAAERGVGVVAGLRRQVEGDD